MREYKENPKTKGSGIVCAIPQTGRCPNGCKDCFFQGGRSYLGPLKDNLPNMPVSRWCSVVRVNDGNDSNVDWVQVLSAVHRAGYAHRFYNTAIPKLDFDGPVVLTVNPGDMTDKDFHKIDEPPKNLMMVRARVNAWNQELIDEIVKLYTSKDVPVILTFMAYHSVKSIPDYTGTLPGASKYYRECYVERVRTSKSYWAITTEAWRDIMNRYENNKWVHSCGKIEGELGDTHCRFCGNCLREYFATMERLRS